MLAFLLFGQLCYVKYFLAAYRLYFDVGSLNTFNPPAYDRCFKDLANYLNLAANYLNCLASFKGRDRTGTFT